jgi:hypothetical protein
MGGRRPPGRAGISMRRKPFSPSMPIENTGTSERRASSRTSSKVALLALSTPSVTSTTALLSAGTSATRRMASAAAS